MIKNILPVILAGGSGFRLWPMSRSNLPKQFLPILENDRSLFQNSLRLINYFERSLIISNATNRFLVSHQMLNNKNIKNDIILEPYSKNTFPAAVVATLYGKENGFDYVLLLPSDHYYNQASFIKTVSELNNLDQNSIYTFGIMPSFPASEYGYIQYDIQSIQDKIYKVEKFIEKPSIQKAIQYVNQENFCFNSGIFILPCDYFLKLSQKFMKDDYKNILSSYHNINHVMEYKFLEEKSFEKIQNISIDYAIIEKANNIKMIKCPDNLKWADLGSYGSIYNNLLKQDNSKNVTIGNNIVFGKSKNSMIINKNEQQNIITSEIDNILLVVDKETIFVSKLENSNFNVKEFLNNNPKLKNSNYEDLRPWGKYENILQGSNFKIKKITILPMKATSLQLHQQRNEHWIIIKGVAEVICDENIHIKKENESIYVPKGTKHKIKNLSEVEDLIFIEIQHGEYLEEDDIIRFEDQWNRR